MFWMFILQLFINLAMAAEEGNTIMNETTVKTTFMSSSVSTTTYYYYSSFTRPELETEIPPCGTFELTEASGSFNSPQHPKRYKPDQDCVWHITVAKGMKIELTVSNIDIEFQSSCEFDALRVFDGAMVNTFQIAQICHRGRNSSVVRSSGNQLTVTFQSDEQIGGDGFTVNYVSKSCFNVKVLKNNGDVKWYKFTDEPKTKASNLKKALLGGKKKEFYQGLSKKDVIFHVQGKSKFTLQEVSFKTRFASGVKFTFFIGKKGGKAIKTSSKSIKTSNDWTSITISHPRRIIKFTASINWNKKMKGKGKDKINVKDFKVKACLDK